MKKILIWGTGNYLDQYISVFHSIFDGKSFELIGFIDNDPQKLGKIIWDRKVYMPLDIAGLEFDDIVCAVSKENYPAIKRQIIGCNVPEKNIHTFTWFLTATGNSIRQDQGTQKVFDCFPFYNELDILELRMELMDPVVDYFVLAELEKTHRWEDKPLFFRENRHRYEKYLQKVIYVCPEKYPKKNGNEPGDWTLENYQRNCIMKGLEGKAGRDDIVLVSDVDEIPDPEVVCKFRDEPWRLDYDVFAMSQDFYYYYFDFCHVGKWNGTYVLKYKNLDVPQKYRNICGLLPDIANGGWHLSYFGGSLMVAKKIDSIVDSTVKVSPSDILERIFSGKDIYGREGREFELTIKDIAKVGMPRMDRIQEKYPQFFREGDGFE